ncbi:MAG: 1-deoxy-D-xylulose-5-phosphate reductoisomerase [Candidatus Omnitrophota bacterium]
MKEIVIFGSTGSVGKNALDVIAQNPNGFKVKGLCVHRDTQSLRAQIKAFSPSHVCVVDEKEAEKLRGSLNGTITLFAGKTGLEEFSSVSSDISLMAIAGISCLKPLLINMKHTKRIALANKESVVTAGNFIFAQAKRNNTEIIPVDSEINALFQLCGPRHDFGKVYLTASGGALFNYKKKDLHKVNVKTVLSHPTWKMGQRITVDSATLVNKGFEVIETHYFFNLPYERIGIMLHRESTIHALVECHDGMLFACLYPPDMRIPIAFALNYPTRWPIATDRGQVKNFSLSFAPLRYNDFPLLKIILEAARRKDNALIVLNACDEVAISYFLQKKIKFTDIYKVMEYIFQHYPKKTVERIEDVFWWDTWARQRTKEYLEKLC